MHKIVLLSINNCTRFMRSENDQNTVDRRRYSNWKTNNISPNMRIAWIWMQIHSKIGLKVERKYFANYNLCRCYYSHSFALFQIRMLKPFERSTKDLIISFYTFCRQSFNHLALPINNRFPKIIFHIQMYLIIKFNAIQM